jgi:hypothetical protein
LTEAVFDHPDARGYTCPLIAMVIGCKSQRSGAQVAGWASALRLLVWSVGADDREVVNTLLRGNPLFSRQSRQFVILPAPSSQPLFMAHQEERTFVSTLSLMTPVLAAFSVVTILFFHSPFIPASSSPQGDGDEDAR